MAFIDIVLGIFLLYGLYKGLKNGLFVELASLVSFFIGVYVAVKFSYLVANIFGDGSSKSIKVLAFVITLIAVIVGIYFFAKLLSKLANFMFLGWLNTLGGAFFAVLKMMLLLGVLLGLLQKVNYDNALISKETQENSLFFNPILKTSEFLMPVLTDWFNDLRKSGQ
jgi:membrane protein required for colicin V production